MGLTQLGGSEALTPCSGISVTPSLPASGTHLAGRSGIFLFASEAIKLPAPTPQITVFSAGKPFGPQRDNPHLFSSV